MWFFFFSLPILFSNTIIPYYTEITIKILLINIIAKKRKLKKNPCILLRLKITFKNKYAYIYTESYLYLLFLHNSK